jgi:hypothetical protein
MRQIETPDLLRPSGIMAAPHRRALGSFVSGPLLVRAQALASIVSSLGFVRA